MRLLKGFNLSSKRAENMCVDGIVMKVHSESL